MLQVSLSGEPSDKSNACTFEAQPLVKGVGLFLTPESANKPQPDALSLTRDCLSFAHKQPADSVLPASLIYDDG